MQMIQLAMKDPKALVQEVLQLPLKKLFWKGIRYRKLRRVMLILFIAMAFQLKFSRRARSYAVRVTMVLMFSGTFFGLLGSLVLLGIKLRLHNKHMSAVRMQTSDSLASLGPG